MTRLTKQLFQTILSLIVIIPCVQAQNYATPSAIKMNRALLAIKSLYVDDVQEDKLVEEAVKAMVKELDPHSSYMTADEMKDMNEPLQGGFDGIGISFSMVRDTVLVLEVISAGPSEKVGLLPGDRIMTVDGEPIAGVKLSSKDVMKRLKGPKGTLVVLEIKRRTSKEWLSFRIIRDKIPIYSLDASLMLDDNTGYIRLNRFGATTVDEFRQAFEELKKEGMEDLVLDLQSNTGGLMNAAIELSDEFLSNGKCIVYTEGMHNPRTQSDATPRGVFEKGRLVVLIDENSASASEIVSGAIQDWDRGVIMGRRSFGKGLVQRPIPLPDGSSLKLTVARYFTPSGRFIQKPYDGPDNYDNDLNNRYHRGEMIHADSIHFPDSLKTSTLVNKRTIYGGGGIMPDIFIPIDTTRMTTLHRLLLASGVLNRFSLNFVSANRKALNDTYPSSNEFVQRYEVTDTLFQELLQFAKSEQVDLSKTDSISDNSLIKKQLKAYMVRDLWKPSEYYKVMWTENESLLKALELLNNKNRYKDVLERQQPIL